MKSKDIEPFAVYAYTEDRAHIYRYSAVMVLSTDLYMTHRFGDRQTELAPPRSTMRRAKSYENRVGMLMVYMHSVSHDDVRRLRALVSVEQALDAFNGRNGVTTDIKDPDNPERYLGSYRVLTNAGYLRGDYFELTARLDEARRKRDEMAQKHEERRLASLAEYKRLNARLTALGVEDREYVGEHSSPSSFRLSFEDMERLVEMAEHGMKMRAFDTHKD